MNATIFSTNNWWWQRYDARKKIFRGIDREEFSKAKEMHIQRMTVRYERETNVQRYLSYIAYFASAMNSHYDEYADWTCLVRPNRDGRGVVAIAPSERYNNTCVRVDSEDPAERFAALHMLRMLRQ